MGIFDKLFRRRRQRGEKDVEGLIKAYKDKNALHQIDAVDVLVEIGEPTVKPLIQYLKDEDFHFRAIVAEILGKIKDPRAIEPLIQLLKDEKNLYVRAEAVWALANIGKPAVDPLSQALVQALQNEDRRFEKIIREVLWKIKTGDRTISFIKEV